MYLIRPLLLFMVVALVYDLGASNQDCNSLLDRLAQAGGYAEKMETLFSTEEAQGIVEELRPGVHRLSQGSVLGSSFYRSTFDRFIDHRIALLPTELQDEVRYFVDHQIQIQYTSTVIQGLFDHRSQPPRIVMSMPESYQGSLIHYLILVHELEHLIQHLTLDFGPRSRMHPHLYTVYRFNIELGAMRAEAAFFHLFPTWLIEQLTNELAFSIHDLEQEQMIVPILGVLAAGHSSDDVESYIVNQWTQGRYSAERMRDARNSQYISIVMGIAGAFAATTGAIHVFF